MERRARDDPPGMVSPGGRNGLRAAPAVEGEVPADTVWLNANENPEGPPETSRAAIAQAIVDAGRYHHRAFPALHAALARSAGVASEQVTVGAGSTEVLHCALDAFTSPAHPLVTIWPTWGMTSEVAAAAGRRVIRVQLNRDWSADVERLAHEAGRAGAGVVHLGNPNNPTSSATGRQSIAGLVENLPPATVLLVDEAYIHFADAPKIESALRYVRDGRSVVVTRTFSKLYGMAGVRVGFGCAPAGLIRRMQPFRNNVISILGARAAMAAVALGDAFVAERRARRNRIRAEFCAWLDRRGCQYIPPRWQLRPVSP